MWNVLMSLISGLIFLFICIILKYTFLTFPLDTAEARRKLYPADSYKRSHPSPQVGWHPALKITEQPNGLVDDMRVEKSLHTEHGYYTTVNEGVKIFWKSYRPKQLDEVTHAMVFCHGYGDHCDYQTRQEVMTNAALNKAWAFTLDMPGHGRSDGLWGYIGDWALMIEQIAELVQNIFLPRVKDTGKPVFCWGKSQGGAVAIHLCMLRPKLFEGVVLVCPMCYISDDIKAPDILVQAAIFVSNFAGTLPLTVSKDHMKRMWKDSRFYDSLVVGPFKNKLRYNENLRLATTREILKGSSEIIRRCETDMTTPFILVHGGDDHLCPIVKSREFYNKAAVEDKTFERIAGGWHGFLVEEPCRIFDLIFNWVNKRIK